MFEKYSNSFLKDFDIDIILSKIEVKDFISFGQDQIIFKENDPSMNIYFILSGEVEIKKFINNKTESLGIIGPGELIGLEDILTGSNYSKSASALKKTDTVLVMKNEFVKYMENDCEFRLWVCKYLNSRISSLQIGE